MKSVIKHKKNMDNFDSKEFYGHNLSGDPQLRTTTRNYEFKFNSSDHLERIINRVKMDREIMKTLDAKSGNHGLPSSGRRRTSYLKQSLPSAQSKIPQSGKTSSRDTIVKIMSDDDIEAMISQAIQSRPCMPMTSEQSEARMSNRRQIEAKFSKISEELILCQQPQWVQIKPAEKAFARAANVPGSSDENTPDTVLDLAKDETHSLLAKSSSDFLLRNGEADHKRECDTPPDSPLSFGIESPLNECERAEMLRVLGHVIPDIPAAALDSAESQDESLYSDSVDDEQEEDDQGSTGEDRSENEVQPCEDHEVPTGQQQQRRLEKHPVDTTAPTSANTRKPLSTYRSSPNQSSRRNHPMTPLDKTSKKQIETLKQEKIRIFSKMTSIHEKIIEVLDRLRISLVELSLPDGNVEVKLRERNALEFSVRLSRNYLFPLGRMIEELRVAPKEDFQSATTNEACVKVCGIYGLLNQALQCYHKQLRHFFTDRVPKKLDILIDMVAQTTKLCLQKNIFDQRDTLIQHLLERCDLFKEFVQEFAELKKSAREGEYPLKSSRREQHKLPRTSSKWELTMNLNNLNMYEPKLVPRVQKKIQPKKLTPTGRQSSRNKESRRATPRVVGRHDRDDGDCIAAPPEDPDDTQVRLTDVNNSESVQIFNSVMEEQPDSELTRNLIEALQNITKDEVRQLLGPIFSNFDSLLRNSDNPESVESALSLLNSQLMAKYTQPRVDAENSPQTNDTDQKEVTKRSANYRKEAKSTEHQCNHTAARRPERLIKTANVKQGSTKATKQRDMSSGRPNTRNERHSLSNTSIAVQHADKNDAKKRSFRSCSVVSDKAAKKPTPAVTASPLEAPALPPPPPQPPTSPIPPPTPPTTLTVSAPVNEVIPPRSRTHTPSVSKHKMTSRRIENTTTTASSSTTTTNSPPAEVGPNNKQKADKFAPERQKIEVEHEHEHEHEDEDGGRSKEFRKQSAANDAATIVVDVSGEDDQYTKVPVPAGKMVGTALLVPGQVETLTYCSNVMYTFAKYNDENPAHLPDFETVINVGDEDIPEKECFTASCTRLKLSTRSSRNPSYKSTFESTQNLLPPPEDEARVKEEVKKLIEDRNNFIDQCKDDPLYTNPQFPQPWKVLSKYAKNALKSTLSNTSLRRISHKIANEVVQDFESNLSFDEELYVRDFINMEMQT